jgi:hypothetical protein
MDLPQFADNLATHDYLKYDLVQTARRTTLVIVISAIT